MSFEETHCNETLKSLQEAMSHISSVRGMIASRVQHAPSDFRVVAMPTIATIDDFGSKIMCIMREIERFMILEGIPFDRGV